jgi:HemY protein
MRRILGILLVAALALGVAWYLAGLPGTITARIGATTIVAPTAIAALAAVVAFLLGHAALRLLAGLWHLPRRWRAWCGGRHRHQGERAATRAMVALAAGEAADARHEAARARRLLGDTAQTLLLAAQAARLAGQPEEAEAALKALTQRPDTAFLGFRGLLRRANERGDWDEAARLAGQADAAHPGAAWLRGERARLAARTGRWEDALALADADAPKAALGVAAAEAATDPARARQLARRAWKDDPALTPAALAYASRLRAAGRERRARAVIRRTWTLAPHPDLAEFALAPVHEPLARMQAAQHLAAANPDHPEAHFLLARTALTAGLLGEARRHADAANQAGLTQRRLWLLRAAIEEAADGTSEAGRAAQRDALRHAAEADPDPTWRCTACQAAAERWSPACPSCAAAGSLRWSAAPPPSRLLAATG